MKLDDLLRFLTRDGVSEIALQSGRLPCVMIEGALKPIADKPLDDEAMVRVVVATGSSRHASMLGPQHLRWSFTAGGVGLVDAVAVKKGDVVQVRFQRSARQSIPAAGPAGGPKSSRSGRARVESVLPLGPLLDAESLGGLSLALEASPDARRPSTAPEPARGGNREIDLDLGGHGGAPAPVNADARFPAAPPDGFDDLLAHARKAKASDVHLVAGRPPLLRIAGDLRPHPAQTAPLGEEALEQMLLARVPERLQPILQVEGACVFAVETEGFGRVRVSVTRERRGVKGAIRLVAQVTPTVAALGLPEKLGQLVQQRQGLVVVTGPPGHGKTTTVAALVDAINRERFVHIVTIEDPVEFVHLRRRALVSHREVGTHSKTLDAAVRSTLRHDPDVIVMGELCDARVMRVALAAVEKGHLVLGTCDAPSAARAIERLIELFSPDEQPRVRGALAGALHLVVAQRLLPNPQHTALVVATEVLPGSPTLSSLIKEGNTQEIPAMQQRGKALGLVRLDDSLAELVRTGKTSLETARAHAESPDELAVMVAGRRAPVLGRKAGA